MENFKPLCLLDSETNIMYDIKVSQEVYDRASNDMVFATQLLNRRIKDGIKIFDVDDVPASSTAETPENTTVEKRTEITVTAGTSEDNNQKSGMHSWTKQQVLLLISVYKEHQLAFLEENGSKHEIWTKIVNDMTAALAEQGLPPISAKKCKTKMDTLKRHYKNVKDSQKKTGTQKLSWPYYDEMDEIFGEQPWVKPLSTAGSNVAIEMDPEIINRPPKRKRTLQNYCEELLENKKKKG